MSSTLDDGFVSSYFKALLNATLTEYAEQTGVGLWGHPLTSKIDSCDNPESILVIFQEQARVFDKFRKGDTRLLKWLRPIINVLCQFSINVALSACANLVVLPTNAVLSSILILISMTMHEGESYEALVDIFECVENVLRRLKIYTAIPPNPMMIEKIIEILLKLLSFLALATKQYNQGRFKRYAKTFLGEKDIESVLLRLDRLTLEESRITVAHTLDVVYGLVNIMQVIMEDGEASIDDIRQPLVLMQSLILQPNEVERDQLQEKFRHWLSPPDPWVNHYMARDMHNLGTATWFIRGDDFRNWKSEGSLLWIHGLPGSGKSVLCSSIIEDIQALREIGLANLAFFYFDFRDIGKQNAGSLLSSLLVQLCHKSDEFSQILSSFYSAHDDGSVLPSEVVLMECLKNILKHPEQGEIYIVVDALDECPTVSGIPTPRGKVLAIIKELSDLRLSHVHLCVTSRLEVDIRYVLVTLAVHKVLLHEQAGHKQDIIKSLVSSDLRCREDRRLGVKTLAERGRGMFRWICCLYDDLDPHFPGSIRHTLGQSPITLNQTYEWILGGIDEHKQDFVHRIFQCLVVCRRPLRVEELAELFTIRRDAEMIPAFHPYWLPVDPEEAVLSACSSLVTVVNVDGKNVVQFSHFSMREYLTSDHVANSEHVYRFWVLPRQAHAHLARVCLSVLLELDDHVDRDNIQDFPLALYAAQYWIDHAQFEDVLSDIQHAIKRLFDRNKPHFAAWLRLYDIDSPFAFIMPSVYAARPYPVLYYAALCGFRDVTEHLVDAHPQDLNARSGTRGTPLHAALDGGHQGVAMLLLERGADIGCLDSQSRTPLHIACRGCTGIVSALIDRGVDLNAEDDSRENPLHVASQWGRYDIIRLLLDHSAEVDHLDSGGWTPLHVASHRGHDKIVQLLFNYDADADRPDNGGWTPLHLASWEGHERIVRLLLDHGINANHPDNGGWTPLHAASQEGHNHIVRLLLDRGADPSHANCDGSTSLHVASQRNHHYIVQLLLDHGADPNSSNGVGSTSLHVASQRNHHYIVQLLLDHDADPNSSNSVGSTSLHLASQRGCDDTVQLLLHHGADVNRLNGDGWASVHLASQRGHHDVVGLLLEHGADSNHAHGNGLTPLHLASQEGHHHIARLLLYHGADANSLNSDECSPLYLALQRGHDHIVPLLVEHGADAEHPNSGNLTPIGFALREGGVEWKLPEGFANATRTRRRV